MVQCNVISADTHVVEPGNLYLDEIEPKFRDRAPRMNRRRTPAGNFYDAWFLGGVEIGGLGGLALSGQRFNESSRSNLFAIWEDVRKSAYNPHDMIKELAEDGIWGACIQASQAIRWYGIQDIPLVCALFKVYNDWIAAFCKYYPSRLRGIPFLQVEDLDQACKEMIRCAKLGW